MKETTNMEKFTKKELYSLLKTNAVKAEGDQNLFDRINYAVKTFETDQKKVSREDLLELCQELSNIVIPTTVPAETTPAEGKKSTSKPKESSLKPKNKGSKKTEKPAEKEAETTEETEEETPAEKPNKKKGGIKSSKKKNEVESLPPVSTKGIDTGSATFFPEVLELEGLDTKLVSCAGEYESFDQIRKALEAEKSLYFACYWTKAQVKKFDYAGSREVKPETCKNGFPNDLDILNAVLTCETMDRLFAMSLYTEALFRFDGDDFRAVEDTDPRSGKKFRVRVSAGMEFEIYRPEDEEIFSE